MGVTNTEISPENEGLIMEYLNSIDKPKSTKYTYRKGGLESFAKYLGDKLFTEATAFDLSGFRDTLLESGKAASTVNTYLDHNSGFYRWMKYMEYINKPIYEKVGKLNADFPPRRVPTKDEVKAIFEQCKLDISNAKSKITKLTALRDACMMSLMFFNGLRRVSVQNIQMKDIQIQSVPMKDGNLKSFATLNVLAKGKKTKSHFVVLDSVALSFIDEYLKEGELQPHEFLFVSHKYQSNNAMTRKALSDAFIKKVKSAGVYFPKFNCHNARHFCGSMIYELRDLESVAAELGHKSTSTSKIYVKMAMQDRLMKANADDWYK